MMTLLNYLLQYKICSKKCDSSLQLGPIFSLSKPSKLSVQSFEISTWFLTYLFSIILSSSDSTWVTQIEWLDFCDLKQVTQLESTYFQNRFYTDLCCCALQQQIDRPKVSGNAKSHHMSWPPVQIACHSHHQEVYSRGWVEQLEIE